MTGRGNSPAGASSYRAVLGREGFWPFLLTQFLGAFNDNVYKIVLLFIAADLGLGVGAGGGYLSLVGAVFVLPYVLFSGYAGHLADAFDKRRVLIVTKSLEVVAMIGAAGAFLMGRIEAMLVVLFVMGLQSTLFSPAKYGILPELFQERDLSRANGLVETSTFVAIILGTSAGSVMFGFWSGALHWIALVLIAFALAGWIASFRIAHVPAPSSRKRFRLSPWAEVATGLTHLYRDQSLWFTVLGITCFWFLGALVQMDIILYGKELMGLDELKIGLFGAYFAIGIGIGSLAAGRLSGERVELGLVPWGALGIAGGLFLLYGAAQSYAQAALALGLMGFAGGLYIVPLNAFLQLRAGGDEKGRLIATNNVLNMAGILLASGVLWGLHDGLGLGPDEIVLAFGLLTLMATIAALLAGPRLLIRAALWAVTHSVYRLRTLGEAHIPLDGPALLVCNHLTFVDGLFVSAALRRPVRFIINRRYYDLPVLNGLFRRLGAIPIAGESPKQIARALVRARDELRRGEVVCIFAEGGISRTGNMLPFKRGLERITRGLEVPIVPVHLDRLWGSIFSFKGGRFFWKWPERLPYPVTISFGPAITHRATAWEVRQAILELGVEAARQRGGPSETLALRFVRTAKRRWLGFAMADSSGTRLGYGKTLIASLVLARRLARHSAGSPMIGVLLPASTAGALSNIALTLAGAVPVNLNFSAGPEAVGAAVKRCGIRTVITSRRFLDRVGRPPVDDVLLIEDLLAGTTPFERVLTAVGAFVLPARWLCALCGADRGGADRLATVLFSSGSTGAPKGIMLSHRNILANVEAVGQVFDVTKCDRIMGALPFFHAFGLTGTIWFPMVLGAGVVYHANPLDGRRIGRLTESHGATVLLSTPTFLKAYLRLCSKRNFATLRYVITGAERLGEGLADAFADKFGPAPFEGYGASELGPVVAVNLGTSPAEGASGPAGSVGHPLPGVAVKLIDPDTGSACGPGETGLLLVRSPSCMLGYLGEPEATEAAFRDGWYVSGDIARLDRSGFLYIVDRLARFSKVGGEMIPHVKIEQAINRVLGEDASVVTSVPDEGRGERLVALYSRMDLSPKALRQALVSSELPRLWLPKVENLYPIRDLPLLAVGKADLRKAREMAIELVRAGLRRPSVA
jgi:acyl-[acyl-carrier-protein]-phospholipid O-acyltransferase/long-chain-fatty-acid--[acyl-carrier-protein] ligase